MKLTTTILIFFIFLLYHDYIDCFSYDDDDHQRFMQLRNKALSANNNQKTTTKYEWENKPECYVEAADTDNECRLLENNTSCFGALIPSTQLWTSNKHLDTLNWRLTHEDFEKFHVYAGLPECWRVLRDLLCSTYYPQCKDGRVFRIPRSLCYDARQKCRFLILNDLWPKELGNCNETSSSTKNNLNEIFSSDCLVPRNLKWPEENDACFHPLVLTQFNTGWMVDKCAMNCTGMRIDRSDPVQSLLIIGISGILIFTCINAAVITLETRKRKLRVVYFLPLELFLYLNLLLLATYLVQISSGAPTTCRDDGAMRLGEPSRRAALYVGMLCLLQFLFIFGSSVLAAIYMAITARMHYTWRRKPTGLKFSPYYHVGAGGFSIIFFIAALSLTQVDGDPLLAICFISKSSSWGVFLFIVPIVISAIITVTFFALTAIYVIRTTNDAKQEAVNVTGDAPKYLIPSLAQVGFLLMALALAYLGSAAFAFFDMLNNQNQKNAILDYILCKLRHDDSGSCQYQKSGDIRLAQFDVFLMCIPALIIDVWLVVCADFGRRLSSYCTCLKRKKSNTNGDIVMKEMVTAGGVQQTATLVDERNKQHRTSWNWSSSSSIPDIASEPESRHISQRAFYNRMKNSERIKHYRATSRSSSNSALCSIKTPLSLQSGPLPPLPPGDSSSNLGFPDLSKYPMLSTSTPNGWPWSPYNWPPYAGWPWPMMNWPMMNPSMTNSATAAGQITPMTMMTNLTPGQQTFENVDPSSSSSGGPRHSTPTTNMDINASGSSSMPMMGGWPMAYPPMAYPFWSPQMAAQMFSSMGENQNVQQQTMPVAMQANNSMETSKATTEKEEKATNELEEEEKEKNDVVDESILNEKIEDRPKNPIQETGSRRSIEDDEGDDEESLEDEEEDEDEEELDSEEIDPEEEPFALEQLRLMAKKT